MTVSKNKKTKSAGSLLEDYSARVAAKSLMADPLQLTLVKRLHQFLEERQKHNTSLITRLLRGKKAPSQGLYIYGPVGRGKTMLMDLLYSHIAEKHKKRVHFHTFMQDVHKRLKNLRAGKKSSDDIMKKLAAEIAKNTRWLCFDEFVVEDIADAMILGRLFENLFDEGVTIVTTSNTPPDDLYKGGLQRELFLPFIDVLKAKMDVLALQGARDYRLSRLMGQPTYLTPISAKTAKALRKAFTVLTDDQVQTFTTLEHHQRKLVVPESGHGAAYFHFRDLCDKSYGADDYLLLTDHFNTIIIEGIPVLGADSNDKAKRFITLIDVLYDHKTRLICQGAVPPQKLYTKGKLAKQFERTASRLMEMQSAEYLTNM